MGGRHVATVRALRRFPVKSTGGEDLDEAVVATRGLRHDREWAVVTADGGIGSGKRTRRFRPVPGLLDWTATIGADGVPLLTAPDGRSVRADDPAAGDVLSSALGQPLALRREGAEPHHDDCPVHLVTTSALAALGALVGGAVDPRRFRANLLLDTGEAPGWPEDAWAGELAIGDEVVLRLGPPMPRCVMVDQPQPGVDVAVPVLRPLGQGRGGDFGLMADVLRPGTVRIGDPVRLG